MKGIRKPTAGLGLAAQAQNMAYPLLDQKTIRAPWSEACNGAADSTALPIETTLGARPRASATNCQRQRETASWMDGP